MFDYIMTLLQKVFADRGLMMIFSFIGAVLIIGSIVGLCLKKNIPKSNKKAHNMIDNLNLRTKSWWIMCAVFIVAMLTGGIFSLVLFGIISFMAFREYVTIVPTTRGDHRTLFWCFFIILPLQYIIIGINWYGLFAIMIPVYAFLFVPIRNIIAGDCDNFSERVAKIHWGLMCCIYCVSHVPMILKLPLNVESQSIFENAKLLFFFTIVVQISDVFQYCWGKWLGKKKILPTISPNKTVAGFVGGVLSASLVGLLLSYVTIFSPLEGFLIALLTATIGFTGDATMSAIKRDNGIKDYGSAIAGHGGMLDRIDSLCFAAPIFFHVVRYFFVA